MPTLDLKSISASLSSSDGKAFPALHAACEGGGFAVFRREDGAFRLEFSFRMERGDYAFLRERPDVWLPVLDEGFILIPSEFLSDAKTSIWVCTDRLKNPETIAVVRLNGAEENPGDLIQFCLLFDLKDAEARKSSASLHLPSWVNGYLQSLKFIEGHILLVAETGSRASDLVRKLCMEKFGSPGEAVFFAPGRLSGEIQLREIFGEEAGVRMGKSTGRVPLVKRNASCIVIEEAGDLAISVQSKLLPEILKKDRLWILETSRNLDAMVEEGLFLAEFHSLLKDHVTVLPPLRTRKPDEIIEEALHILKELSENYGRKVSLSEDSIRKITTYSWPGNLDQLRHVLSENYFLSDDGILRIKELRHPGMDDESLGLNLRKRTESLEKELILQSYSVHGGNQVHMARALGISRGSLQYKMNKYGLISEK